MKSRAHYEKLFSSFPDVVTLPEFQSMLGGIGDSTARKIMRANKVKHFYKELFRLPDGGNIIITHTDGEKIKAYCRYIDETHAEIGKNTYHICEFAQHMEDCGATYAPAEPLIPEMCYSTLPSSGEVIKVFRGDRSYIPLKMPIDSATARKYADDMNRRLGVSKAQEAAMLAGSMFGWSVPAADAKNYDENGNPRRPKSKDRGDAR